jgi:hypothetical protein
MENSIIITIPVYKTSPSEMEKESFKQCLKILHDYNLTLFTYKSLNLKEYIEIAHAYNKDLTFEFFNKDYFNNIQGYNKLMLSAEFYNRFKGYTYILIYQLDAWVFYDALEFWCKQNWDYIGAPWIEKENNKTYWVVGNGGLSLRKTDYFISLLNSRSKLKSFKQLYKDAHSIKDYILLIPKSLGFHNNINRFIKSFGDKFNEDIIYSKFMKNTKFSPQIPCASIAISFAFEKEPSFLYQENNNKLPFGCHAFMKYEYETFWKKFITKSKENGTYNNHNKL